MTTKLIGWRVIANGKTDDFELEQAAADAMRLLKARGVHAVWFKVVTVNGREHAQRLPFSATREGKA